MSQIVESGAKFDKNLPPGAQVWSLPGGIDTTEVVKTPKLTGGKCQIQCTDDKKPTCCVQVRVNA